MSKGKLVPTIKAQEDQHALREADNYAFSQLRYQRLRGSLGDLLRMVTEEGIWYK
jgi:hypothetical protein